MDQHNNTSLFDGLSSKQTFIIGAIGGIMTLCTIGFFILLAVVLNGGSFGTTTAKANAPTAPTTGGPTAPTAPTEIKVAEVDKKVDHILGAKNPELYVIEYSDFECPFCERFHPTMQQLINEYGDKVAWVYRHFPLTSIHPNALPFAHATECASDQGKFWEMGDLLFKNQQGGSSKETLEGYAKELGLNVNKFNDCVSSQKFADRIQRDVDDGVAAGVRGTPYSVIVAKDGTTVAINGAQPYEAVKAEVEALLN